MSGPRLVVVGGGISGLATAWFLKQRSPLATVTVLEGSARLGGKLRTVELAGLPVDTGAESMLNRRPEAVELARAVGMDERIRYPGTTSAGLWTRGELRPIPGGTVMGVPADLAALASSGVVSADGLARIEQDSTLPRTPIDGDVAIGSYVAERFGREVVDRLVEPLLGGVYAGHADRLSLHATVPQLAKYVVDEPSLLRAAQRARDAAPPASDTPVFAGLQGGIGQLAAVVGQASGADVRTDRMVRELHRTPTGWQLVVGPTREPELVEADGVVLTCPARPAVRLLTDVAPYVAAELDRIEYASMATIALVFPPNAFPDPLRGSGFLVPPVERRLIKAATYSSRKWDWFGDYTEAAGLEPDVVVVRCSIGRHGEVEELRRDDTDLVDGAVADLSAMTGVRGAPLASYVQRWGGGLPQYAVGHRDLVSRVRAGLVDQPGLVVAGAAYDGVGIAACVGTAREAATQVLEDLERIGRMAG